ncbi:hypothetical protein ABTK13_22315, partial [Acinetobacter baumannii]
GRMTRLLALHFKIASGAELLPHEALLRDILAFRDETRKLGLSSEAAGELDLELERLLTRLDNVARAIEVDSAVRSYSEDDLRG